MFRVIIAKENRVSTPDMPRALATLIDTSTFTQTGVDAQGMPVGTTTSTPPKLFDFGASLAPTPNPNILSCIEWDLVSPFVVVHKGAIADFATCEVGGWPTIDEATWLAQQPVVPVI